MANFSANVETALARKIKGNPSRHTVQFCMNDIIKHRITKKETPGNVRTKTRHYDFVRFGRSVGPEKKASYDYIRFGKRSQGTMDRFDARFPSFQFL
ncbi:hypothetical protein TELCIR_11775 [Teladorsagia circumcincta]|uniref:Uncharacterized protein n=1 Tax=Teladorsagia circumcincta TaxID=45464 RepID=A0A2G9U9V2_TELCI|nr:hypothetical protein TELCIR_11775 [Teladorsagia circumcincta]